MSEEKNTCTLCETETVGGIWTNGDGHGDAQYLGIAVPPRLFYCWKCYHERSDEIPDLAQQINAGFKARGLCGVLEVRSRGRCREPQPCATHPETSAVTEWVS